MLIPNFAIRNTRSIRLAECAAVPLLMVLAGPNGSGKSTILNALREQHGNGEVLYVGPHRAPRKSKIGIAHLNDFAMGFSELLSIRNVPHINGVTYGNGIRDAWGHDSAHDLLKLSMFKLEFEFSSALRRYYQEHHHINEGDILDPWGPLHEGLAALLPHLSFKEVDTSTQGDVKVFFVISGVDQAVEFDDLSSGEKALFDLLYALVEGQIRNSLLSMSGKPERPFYRCVLIDEPELHLHPALQLKFLDYLRSYVNDDRQVIVATQSTAMVEYASAVELYLLRPPAVGSVEENQLLHVASDEERLRYIREQFGSTTNLTALQPIVVVEGDADYHGGKTVPDRKVFRALDPDLGRCTLVAGGGKSQCIALRDRITESLESLGLGLSVIAIVDLDVTKTTTPAGVYTLPVSMIENFMVDPSVLFEVLAPIHEVASLHTVTDVTRALDEILDSLREHEVNRRLVAGLPYLRFRAHGTAEQIIEDSKAFASQVGERYSEAEIKRALSAAEDEVNRITTANKRRELFDGKEVLDQFYRRYVPSGHYSKALFIMTAAGAARRRGSTCKFFAELKSGAFVTAPTASTA